MKFENTQNDFSGFMDSDISDVDLFAVENTDIDEEDTEDKKKNKPETPKPEDSKVEEEENEEEEEKNLFDEEEEEDEDDADDEEASDKEKKKAGTPEPEVAGSSMTTLKMLQSKGFIEYELEEGEELTDELAEEILEDGLDSMFEERIEELFSKTPDILKEMNKFVLKGGDINDYLATIANQNKSGLKEGMDLEEEANQILAVRNGLSEEGYDEEYINAQIEFLKDSDRLKKHAETHFKKWDEKRIAEQKNILKNIEDKEKNEKSQRRALKTKVTDFLNETNEVSGFTVTKEDKRELPNYMSDRTVKLDNGNTITSMQRDLMRVLNSPTGSVQIAKLLKAASEKGELNFDDIVTDSETKVTKKVRENVRRNKKSIITSSGGKKKALHEYF